MATSIMQHNSAAMKKELTALLLKKAGVKKEDIYASAMHRWVNSNLDLLTPAEQRKYQSILSL